MLAEAVRRHRSGDLAQAENLYRRLLEGNPRDANALHLLGVVAFDLRDFDGAERHLREALDLAPDTPDFLNSLASVLSETGRLAEAADSLRRAVQAAPDYVRAGSNLLFLMNLLPGVDGESMLAEHRHWARRHLPAAAPLFQPENHLPHHPSQARPLRLGYLSGDFRDHPVGRILAGVLPRHDRARFHVTCYSNGKRNDAVTAAIREGVDAWRDIRALGDGEAADLVVRDGIDILVDLSGHTRGNRLRVPAARPAPVVASWLGYLNTMGAHQWDWRITSPLADPPAAAAWHSERLWYLDDSLWPWRPADEARYPQPGASPYAAKGVATFGSFSTFRKINPEVLRAWAAVLKAVPGTRMRIHGVPPGESVDRVYDAFEAAGVSAERLDLFGTLGYEKYLAAYAEVDIMLDTFPYSGGATACEALWMGVPVVALAGAGGFARTSACILSSLGLDELVAQDAGQYVDKAVALAGDPKRLSRYRSQLRDRVARAPASDPERFVRGLERAFEAMWKDWTERRAATPGTSAAMAYAEERLASRAADQGRLGDAESHHRKAIALDPASAALHYNLGLLLHRVGDLEGAEAHYQHALSLEPARSDVRSSLLCLHDFRPGGSRQANFEAHRDWARKWADPLGESAGFSHVDRDPGRRLRIGYLSPDFGGHVIGGFVAPLLDHHDAACFETFCYACAAGHGPLRERLGRAAAHWRDLDGLDDGAAAAAIRADGIDILVDLAGHSGGNRLAVVARRPAPLQMTWMGYLNTTGMQAVDYRICDWGSDPPGAERWHRERLLRLPHPQWCYERASADAGAHQAVGADVHEAAAAPERQGTGVRFGCATRFMKLNDAVLALWIRILQAVGGATLSIIDVPDHPRADRLRTRLAEAGMEGRVELLPTLRGRAYWDYLASLDIVLDPFPYTGATTTFDCLWMRAPVVTLAGDCGSARSAASIAAEMGLDELVAHGDDEYVAIAVRLAADPARLAAIKEGLRARMRQSACCDPVLFTANLEGLYRQAWAAWCEGGAMVEQNPPVRGGGA